MYYVFNCCCSNCSSLKFEACKYMIFLNLFHIQVSRRDFQVGMVTILYSPKMAQSVTYLTWMFEHEFIMYSLRPQEINNYLTLFLPFGPLLWLCIALTVMSLIFVLIITGETTSLRNIDFKGKVNCFISIYIFCDIVFLQILSSQYHFYCIRVFLSL